MAPQKINITYLHPHFSIPGGAGNVVLESANRLNPQKFRTQIICIRAESDYKERYPNLSFIEMGGPLPSNPLFWLVFPSTQFKIHRSIKKSSPRIIFPHVLPASWWAFIWKRFHRETPCLWYCHEPSAFIHSKQWIAAISNPFMRIGAGIFNPLLKMVDLFLVSKGPDQVISNSRITISRIKKTYRKKATDVLYPGIDLDFFVPSDMKKKYLFMIGRLTKFKNFPMAIEAMAKLNHKEYTLVIAGEGEEKNNLMMLCRKLGLTNKVRFIGSVPYKRLSKLYGEAKLLLFPGKNEPFGMVPLEALACGTPVIGINSGGLKETVIHNHNGILLDEATPAAMQTAIDNLLADSEHYKQLQMNARRSVENFTWQNHVKKLEQILDDLNSHYPTD